MNTMDRNVDNPYDRRPFFRYLSVKTRARLHERDLGMWSASVFRQSITKTIAQKLAKLSNGQPLDDQTTAHAEQVRAKQLKQVMYEMIEGQG
jgi:hypothetical protein